MNRQILTSCLVATFACLFVHPSQLRAQDETEQAIQRATANLVRQQKYDLRYKMKVGDVFRWSSDHSESSRTQMAGETDNQSSRAQAKVNWEVTAVDSHGNVTFVFQIDSVDMWQQKNDEEAISFNSETDKEAPIDYEIFNQCVGTQVTKTIVTPKGKVLDRQDYVKQAKIGMSKMTILPLPKNPVAVGHQWYVPGTLSAKDEDGVMRHLDTRVHYSLDKVVDNKAYIGFQTEILTPLSSDRVRSQIMQNMAKGYAVFDIERGIVVRREVDWNETVQGFQGAGSYLKYIANYSERFIDPHAKKSGVANVRIRQLDDEPILRR